MKKWAGLDGFFCRALLTQFPGPSVHHCPLPCVASWAPLALTDGQDQISFQRRSLAHTVAGSETGRAHALGKPSSSMQVQDPVDRTCLSSAGKLPSKLWGISLGVQWLRLRLPT